MTAIKLPVRCRGRMSADAQARYDAEVQAFGDALMAIASTLDLKMSGRDWCCYLESLGLGKGDFDKAKIPNRLEKCQGAMEQNDPGDDSSTDPGEPTTLAQPCPRCGGLMIVIEVFEAGSKPKYRPATEGIDSS